MNDLFSDNPALYISSAIAVGASLAYLFKLLLKATPATKWEPVSAMPPPAMVITEIAIMAEDEHNFAVVKKQATPMQSIAVACEEFAAAHGREADSVSEVEATPDPAESSGYKLKKLQVLWIAPLKNHTGC